MAEEQFKYWISTFHYGKEDQPSLADASAALTKLKAMSKFFVIGKEKTKTGGMHLQMYFQFKNKVRRATLVRIMPTFWEPQAANASCTEAAEYCMKDGDFEMDGEMAEDSPADAKRKGRAAGAAAGGAVVACKWKRTRQILTSGGNLDDIDDQIFVQHNGACMAIRRAHLQFPADLEWVTGDQPNFWLYGKAGCGKSRKARSDFPGAYRKLCNKWWDAYDGQEAVIIDDFDKNHAVLCHHLKIWADRYAFMAEIKNGAIAARPQVIVVTSNWAPQEIWNAEEDLEPIRRRFKIINMSPLDGAFVPATPQLVLPTSVLGPTGTQPLDEEDETEEGTGVVDLTGDD